MSKAPVPTAKAPVPATDLFDASTTDGAMDQDFARSNGAVNFEFAFNSVNFSDRVLRIEIVADPPEMRPCSGACSSLADWARQRKRRREELKKEKESGNIGTELTLGDQAEEVEDIEGYDDTQDEEAVAMIEGSPSDDNGDDTSNDSFSWSMEVSQVLRVKEIYISSAILAAKSPFFYKLFSNGMKESEERHATLRINASEEAALMDLLSFMYSGKLAATSSSPHLLDVLMAADKFEVASCMRYCSQMLVSLPMTTESALLYLDLPSSVSIAQAVQPLTDAAKEFLANKYKDLTKFQEEVMGLPLAGVEAVLSSNELQVASEDAIYDFVLKWSRAHYPRPEERREVLASRLLRHVRFSHMTGRKLRKVLVCPDLEHEFASRSVIDALLYKADCPHRQRAMSSDPSTHQRYAERAYKYRPLKVVEFDRPYPQCIAYLDLKREECAKLFPSGRIYSQAFHLASQGFFLSAHCNLDQQSSFHCFGLFLGMQEKGSSSVTVDYEFAARTRPSGEFVSKYKGYYTFTGGKAVGYRNLFAIPWSSFMADDSLFFIDGVLHLRAELTIKQPATSS
ncbi:hypothetical protein LUZ60_012546 [Juncus effusus]|nr:hypothetical protein LUZ60_012546 [Juncus effusus]